MVMPTRGHECTATPPSEPEREPIASATTTATIATVSAKGDDNNRSIYKAITDQFYKEDRKRHVILKIASAIDVYIKSLSTTELSFANELKAAYIDNMIKPIGSTGSLQKASITGTKANGIEAGRTYTETLKASGMPQAPKSDKASAPRTTETVQERIRQERVGRAILIKMGSEQMLIDNNPFELRMKIREAIPGLQLGMIPSLHRNRTGWTLGCKTPEVCKDLLRDENRTKLIAALGALDAQAAEIWYNYVVPQVPHDATGVLTPLSDEIIREEIKAQAGEEPTQYRISNKTFPAFQYERVLEAAR
ncbi:hypothetical protein BOTCAL_2949g00010 [Botryotinia calthae]|uniref:Uncharacterized protein n=1 Tax=Botryotinia calthae TaxID=38488 RepID=A0A4Y8C973_9HELO|nr:hypothetical protein BOTCAL_2949g00010 [Botryotinia calthae]